MYVIRTFSNAYINVYIKWVKREAVTTESGISFEYNCRSLLYYMLFAYCLKSWSDKIRHYIFDACDTFDVNKYCFSFYLSQKIFLYIFFIFLYFNYMWQISRWPPSHGILSIDTKIKYNWITNFKQLVVLNCLKANVYNMNIEKMQQQYWEKYHIF